MNPIRSFNNLNEVFNVFQNLYDKNFGLTFYFPQYLSDELLLKINPKLQALDRFDRGLSEENMDSLSIKIIDGKYAIFHKQRHMITCDYLSICVEPVKAEYVFLHCARTMLDSRTCVLISNGNTICLPSCHIIIEESAYNSFEYNLTPTISVNEHEVFDLKDQPENEVVLIQ